LVVLSDDQNFTIPLLQRLGHYELGLPLVNRRLIHVYNHNKHNLNEVYHS